MISNIFGTCGATCLGEAYLGFGPGHIETMAAPVMLEHYSFQRQRSVPTPHFEFRPPLAHDDAVVSAAQKWLGTHYSVARPVRQLVSRSRLPERTFKRRFTKATGHAPISYVQRLRIDEARQRLVRTGDSIEEIGWQVGYEDPAFFRRLFKRLTGMTPGAYRRAFRAADLNS